MIKNENATKVTFDDGQVRVAVIDKLVRLEQLVASIQAALEAQGYYPYP